MKPFVRYAVTITATAAASIAAAFLIFGSPTATAQPAGAAPTPAAPAPAAPAPAPAGAAAPAGDASSAAAPAGDAAGSAAAPAAAPAGDAAGSAAAPAGDAGSAAAPAGDAAGSAAAPAGDAKPPKPTIVPVDCATAKVTLAVKASGSGFDLSCVATAPDQCSVRKAFALGTAVRFEPGSDEIHAYPEDVTKTPDLRQLRAPANQATCIRFDATGKFRFRAKSRPVEATLVVKTWYELLADRPIDEGGNFWMPKSVNVEADSTDKMFYAVLGLSAFFFIAIAIAVVYFVVKYRHRPGHKAEPSAAHSDALEITWTVIPTIICVFLFYYGWRAYVKVVTPPQKAVEVNVLAWRWAWQFTHNNGVKDKDLHVPVNTPVRLVMTSRDVLHAFYAPVMRVKQDIVPRRYTYAWFIATKPGTYRLTCAEYCGTDHSQMGINPEDGRRAVVVVHEPTKYEQYLADEAARAIDMPPAQLGQKTFEKNCTSCHTADGSAKIGPTFKGSFGTMVQLSDGSKVKMDESYIRESILNPSAKARPGFPAGTMSSFEGQLKEKEIEGLIAFIKSLK